jgi:hypothetical protein
MRSRNKRHRSYLRGGSCFVFAARRQEPAIIARVVEMQAFLVNAMCRRSPRRARCARGKLHSVGSKRIVISSRCTYELLGTRHRPAKFILSSPSPPPLSLSLSVSRLRRSLRSRIRRVGKLRRVFLSDVRLFRWKFNYRPVDRSSSSIWLNASRIPFLSYVFPREPFIIIRELS